MLSTAAAVKAFRHPSRIFRGWYVLAAIFVGGMAMFGAGMYSFLLFVKPLASDFHWSYAVTGGLFSAFYFSGPLYLMMDWLIRRVGVKRLVISGILIEAAALICFSGASDLWEMYLLRAFAGLGKILYYMTLPVILSKWFSRRFGLSIAIMSSGWLLGGVVFAPVTEYLLHAFGWRIASTVLGIVVLVITLPPSLWMLRVESAAEMDLALDGCPLTAASSSYSDSSRHDHFATEGASPAASLAQLLQHRGFQLLVIATVFYGLSYSGLFALQPTTVEASGVSARMASAVLSGTSAVAIVGELIGGYAIDRFSLAFATVTQYVLMGAAVLALLTFLHLSWGWLLAVHAVAFGLAIGWTDPFWITVLKRKMPAGQFPRALGIWYFLSMVNIIVAPIGAGRLYDVTGSFAAALAVEFAFVLVAVPVTLILARRAEVAA